MKHFSAICLLVGSLLAAPAATEGFMPLTPEGYPAGGTNAPAEIPASALQTPLSAPAPAATETADTNAPLPTSVAGVVMDDRHKLVPGDKLSFRVVEDRDEAKPLMVADTGELDVPYIGRINVSGRTCKEVAAELKVLLEKDYYYQATVVLGLDQISRVLGRVYVWGQVRNQGPIEIPANEVFTAGKAILRAGGFGDFANKKKVKVVRNAKPGEPAGKEDLLVNMEEVLEEGRTDKDVILQPDDFIIVPARLINW
jgi:protein involved in polysaccharide export with SLBB domain